MSNPVIRPAVPADVPGILVMIAELAAFEKLSHLLVTTEADLQESFFGPHPAAECLVVESGAGLVGYAIFFSTFSTFVGRAGIWLEDIYIRPDFRGSGVGKQLIVEVGEIAKQRNAGRYEWCVLDWNQKAIDFYEHIGSDVMKEWRICRLGEDGIKKLVES